MANDPQRCEALLRDYCGTHRREISLLVSASRERVPSELLSSAGKVPQEILRSRLVNKLEENLAITNEAAQWTVDAWAAALDITPPPVASAPPDAVPGNSKTSIEPARLSSNPSPKLPPSDPVPPKAAGAKPTEVVGVGQPRNYQNQNQDPAPTQVRPLGLVSNPGAAHSGAANVNAPTLKRNFWLLGVVAGVAALSLVGLVLLLALFSGSQELQTALEEAESAAASGEYDSCITKLEPYTAGSEPAQEQTNKCHLGLAKELADKAKFVPALKQLRAVKQTNDSKTYDTAQTLMADWSKGRQLRITNKCPHPVQVALRFSDPKNNNVAKADGWWKLAAGGNSYLLGEQDKRIRILDPVYFFAETTDDSNWVWEGDEPVRLNRQTYKMRAMKPELDDAGQTFTFTLTCNTP